MDEFIVRNAKQSEFQEIGALMVKVYTKLEGFPNQDEQPDYYKMLSSIGRLTENPETKLLVAVSPDGKISGGVIYIGDMRYYGSGGTATSEKQASGFRLLAVDPACRGKGLGRLLAEACVHIAKEENQKQVIIHTTKSMQAAWHIYEDMGFKRSEDLDFMQGALPVFGFRLLL